MIPLVNLTEQFAKIRHEIMPAIEEVIAANAFIQGKFVARFEEDFLAALGAKHGFGCSNGTAAIALALEALGVGRGDEVITVPNTFIATVEAICQVGAVPVFVDVDPATHAMNPALIEAAITPRTKALMPVHLYGNVCNMAAISAIADKHGLKVIEDAAQAHLATFQGKAAGTWGDAATFSFYPGKNLGAFGDAGFVLLRDEKIARRARQLADHGRTGKYEHELIGSNQRMDGIQGAVLGVKLKYLSDWTATRQRNADLYRANIKTPGLRFAQPTQGAQSVYHLMVVEVANREEVMGHLSANGIASGIHYPIPLHLQPALARFGGRGGMFPVAEHLAGRILSLPMCAELTADEIAFIAARFDEVARA